MDTLKFGGSYSAISRFAALPMGINSERKDSVPPGANTFLLRVDPILRENPS